MGKWRTDPAQREKQDRTLNEQIVPMVKQAPGFVSGYWGRATDGVEAVSFIVFKDQAAAEGFAATVESDPEDRVQVGVEPGWLSIVEVQVTAE